MIKGLEIYNIFRVINELYQEQYLGEQKIIYLKFFSAWLVRKKCPILKHHNKNGLVTYIDTEEVCHICSGTNIDYNFNFKKLLNIFENKQRDISIKCHENKMEREKYIKKLKEIHTKQEVGKKFV